MPSSIAHGPVAGTLRHEAQHARAHTPAGADPQALSAGLARLRHAIEHGLFVLHFQPIVSVSDRRVCHYEALLRLADEPDGALIAPARFLPAAERYGLIGDIDRLVLDRVLALLSEHTPCRIAVNVSALSVTDPTMLSFVERRLRHYGVAPSRLSIEITETAAIPDMDRAREFCRGALVLGCGVALDDFGAGFGSFQYLKRLPFSHLKLDGEFIRRLPASPIDQLLVSALTNVAHGMGAKTVAEFVGDEQTMQLLGRYGVDYAQGFAVGRPQAWLPGLV
ncbi:MAG TPA: EAL domain-containing protein [Solirubrobacteraceae bacterium]|jgi:EAL domain-containing protein (putative c-di-GMP-specific phosphodiesterase class I)|nr:EAL domain-containing protein [Solirubrobacteraceae bacterium]